MGTFVYGDSGDVKLRLPDRVLLHLEYVITGKLRRGEKFLFSWNDDAAAGHGRTTVWLSTGSTLSFAYSDNRREALNRDWLKELMQAADSPAGLHLTPEPASEVEDARHA